MSFNAKSVIAVSVISVCSVWAVTEFSLVVIIVVSEENAASIFSEFVHSVGSYSQSIVTRLTHECSLPLIL